MLDYLRAGLGHLANAAGAVANVVDTPGSMIRDTLAFHNPFDQLYSSEHGFAAPLHDTNRTTGREMLQQLGHRAVQFGLLKHSPVSSENTWGNWGAGIGAEMLTDPTTLIPGRSLLKAYQATRLPRAIANSTIGRNVKNFIHNAEQTKILRVGEAARNRAIAKNVPIAAHNLDVQRGLAGREMAMQEARDQIDHVLPQTVAPLPANHSVDINVVPESVRNHFPHMLTGDALHVAYGTPRQRAEVLAKRQHGTVGELDELTQGMGDTVSTRVFGVHGLPKTLHGFMYGPYPHEVYVNATHSPLNKIETVHHELTHAMHAMHPETLNLGLLEQREVAKDLAKKVSHDTYGWFSDTPYLPKHLDEAVSNAVGHSAKEIGYHSRDPVKLHAAMKELYPTLPDDQIARNVASFLTGDMHRSTSLVPVSPVEHSMRVASKSFHGLPNIPEIVETAYTRPHAVPDLPKIVLKRADRPVPKVPMGKLYTAAGLTAASTLGRKHSHDRKKVAE